MKRRILSVLAASVIACGAFSAPVQTALSSQAAVCEAATAVSTPSASKKSGTYAVSSSLKVTLTSSTKNAEIYYSVNDGSYKLYTSPIKITKNTVIKTYALKNGTRSAKKTYTYKLAPKFTVSLAEGSFDSAQTVYLSSKLSGVKYYYTLDGTKPTTKSTLYTAKGITISESCKLRVVAVKSGWNKRYTTKSYTINAPKAESILDYYTGKWGYSMLSDAQKKGYAALFEAAATHAASASVAGMGLSVSDMEKMYWAFDYDNPQFFWMENGYAYTYMLSGEVVDVQIRYSRTASEAKKIQTDFESAANEIIAEALKQDSTAERVRVLHDSLVNMTSYTTSGGSYKSEADGPLVYGKALCEGYSKAFMYLCQSIGVECVCISGTGDGMGHMWNMVKIDGQWYHVDVTWDDPLSTTPILRHDYFLVSDKQILKDHTIDNFFKVPSAPENYEA